MKYTCVVGLAVRPSRLQCTYLMTQRTNSSNLESLAQASLAQNLCAAFVSFCNLVDLVETLPSNTQKVLIICA